MSSSNATDSSAQGQTTTIADEDAAMLERFIVIIATKGALYGVHVILAMAASWILIRKGLRNSLARRILFFAIFWMFIDSTVYFVVSILYYTIQIRGAAVTPYNAVPLKTKLEILTMIFPRIDYFLGDAIVVWRAWVLFERWSIPRLMLALCLTGTFVTTFVDGARNVKAYPMGLSGAARLILPLPLLITNVTATLLIAYKAWNYHCFLRSINHSKDITRPESKETTKIPNLTSSKKPVEQLLYLLVESGWIYCVIWVVAIIALFPIMSDVGISVMSAILPFLTSIYPTLIIILVSVQTSPLHPGSSWNAKRSVAGNHSRSYESRSDILFASDPQSTNITRSVMSSPPNTVATLSHTHLESNLEYLPVQEK